MQEHIEFSLREAQTALEALLINRAALAAIEQAAQILIDVFQNRGCVASHRHQRRRAPHVRRQ